MLMHRAGVRPALKVTHIPMYMQFITRLRSRRTQAAWLMFTLQVLALLRAYTVVRDLDYKVGAADVDGILAWLAVAMAAFVCMVLVSRRYR